MVRLMKSTLILLLLIFAAASHANAQPLPTRLEGQIVCCEECWNRADRKTVPYGTRADLVKAADCIAEGDPTLIAVTDANGAATFYRLEEGRYKKPGPTWLELAGSRVAVSGAARKSRGRNFFRVDELKVMATPAEIAPEPDMIGTQAELVLKDMFGVEQKLSALRGRIVVLNFWATWCGPCIKEMPDLASIQNRYAALGVQVIGASADTLADRESVRKFISDLKINFPVWLGATVEDMSRFGLGPALPATAIIGRDGRIVALFPGVITQDDLIKHIDALIAQSERDARSQVAIARGSKPDVSNVPS